MEIYSEQQNPTPDTEWTEDLCLKLITLYRISPELWDHQHSNHFKKEKKDEAWKAIGRELNKSPQACKHKMSVLFSSFRREKAKIMKSIRKTGTSTYASSWFGFKAMSFLLIKARVRQPLPATRQNKQRKKQKDNLQHRIQEAIVAEQLKLKELADRLSGKKSSEAPGTPTATQNADSAVADTSNILEDDEIKSFTNFVAIKMKKYSEGTQSAVQQAISNILFQADQGHFDRSRNPITSTMMMSPRDVMQPKDNVQALIVKEEDFDSE